MKTLEYRENVLPDFLIIGAMKCGTTSLHYYLNCHPEISMSTEKELDFFIENRWRKKGVDWYKSQFKGTARIYGEASPNYSNYPKWKGIPQRIYSLKPDLKLIYVLRDPIERMISHYIHNYDHGRENLSFPEAIINHQDYVFRSSYYLQLAQFLEYFSSENILIITTEELSNFPQKTLESVLSFLNVSEDTSMIPYQKTLHTSVYKRRKNKLGNAIAKTQLMKQISSLPPFFRENIKKLIYYPFSSKITKPKISDDLHQKLTELLQDDIKKLIKHTGKNFEQWSIKIEN